MTTATQPTPQQRVAVVGAKPGTIVEVLPGKKYVPIAANVAIFMGAIAALDANGRAVPASDTAGLKVAGMCEETCDNTGGAAGALSIVARKGVFRYANSATNPVTQALVGKDCYIEDDSTVASTGTHKVRAGVVVEIDNEGVWVDMRGQNRVPAADTITAAADLAALKAALIPILQSAGALV